MAHSPHGPPRGETVPVSLEPEIGWHCSHFFYRFRREQTRHFSHSEVNQFCELLNPSSSLACPRQQSYIIVGHKADFGVMAMGPDPLQINHLHQRLLAAFGDVLECTWSFISISEVSEYVPSESQFAEGLVREGLDPDGPEFKQRLAAYVERLPIMNHQRLKPNIPDWPAACFYPMNKTRAVGANWFMEPFSHRALLMAEHGRSGMAFMGRVSQLITVGVGLDDWEWLVTLWGKNPQYLKDIVYKMRFDEASARYAEFGPFYTGYRASGKEILVHCGKG